MPAITTASSSASCCVVVMQQQPKTNHQEHDADLDLDSEAIVIGAAGGEVKVEKGAARSQRKVRFNDCSLTQVLEFQPSARDDAVSLCAQLCTWLCGQRPANDHT